MAERIEIGGLGERPEEQPEDQKEETNVDTDWRDESIIIPDGSNPDFLRGKQESMKDADRELGKRIGVTRRKYTGDKKSLLREMGIRINKKDSPELFERLKLIRTERDGKYTGAEFDGVKIVELKGDKLEYTDASKVNEFKELVKVAEERHGKTFEGFTERKIADVPPNEELTRSIMSDSIESLENYIDEEYNELENRLKTSEKGAQTEQEVIEYRELRDLLGDLVGMADHNLDNGALKAHEDYLRELAEKTPNKLKSTLCRQIADLCVLKADEIRLRRNEQPESEEVQNLVENEARKSTLRVFERFKQWAKKNLAGLSVVAISVAGIVTTIVMGAKNGVKRGARATSKFAKSLGKVAEKAVPVIGGLLNLAAKLLTLGAKGINFLSNNLWILAVAITYALYEKKTY